MKVKLFFLSLCLLPFFVTSIFNQPAVDDFWSANMIREYGRMGTVKYLYQTASARYFSNFIMSFLNTLQYGEIWMFKVWPVVIFVSLIVCFNFFYASIFQNVFTKKETLLASFFFVVVYFSTTRTLFEELYWMSSTICYQLAICILVVGIGSIIRYLKSNSSIYGLVAILCCLLLPGTAESIVPVYILFLISVLFILKKQKKPFQFIGVCIALVMFCLCFVLVSHGNHTRIQNDGHAYDQNFFYALLYSIQSVGYYSLVWLSSPIIISSFLVILPSLQKLSKRLTIPFITQLNPLILIFASFSICVIIYFPVIYLVTKIPFPRVTTIAFVVATHLSVLIILVSLKNNTGFSRFVTLILSKKYFSIFAWILFFGSAFTTRNFLIITKDLLQGNAYDYNIEANNRYQIIESRKGDTCYVPMYVHWPFFAHYAKTETENSNSFTHMNKYFGKIIMYEKAKQ